MGVRAKPQKVVLPFEKPMQTREQTVPGALALIGLRPEDAQNQACLQLCRIT